MKKHQLDHILRAAGDITGQKQFVIVGSQALHGKYPNLADDIVIINTGRVVFRGTADQIKLDDAIVSQHLGVF